MHMPGWAAVPSKSVSMPLIKNGAITDDPWQFPAEDGPMPETGSVAVSLTQWQREKAALLARSTPLGLLLTGNDSLDDIVPNITAYDLIAFVFPTFQDGRPYSMARLVRERHGYTGELRATGDVSRDQFLFMYRCGFDAFEVSAGNAIEDWLRAVSEISIWYQPTNDPRSALTTLRHKLHALE